MTQSLVTIASYWDPVEARLAKVYLDDAGIRSVLQNEHSVSMNWLEFANSSRGVQLQVDESDIDAAQDVLDQKTPESDEIGNEWNVASETTETGEPESILEPAEEGAALSDEALAAPLNARELLIQRAYVTAILGLLFLPFEFYATYQLGVSTLSNDPLRQSLRKTALQATMINSLVLLAYFLFALQISGYGIDPTHSMYQSLFYEPYSGQILD